MKCRIGNERRVGIIFGLLCTILVASIGSLISVVGVVIFFVVIIEAFNSRRKAANSPWGVGGTTIEWTTTSPPPFHTFDELPKVK